MASLPAGPFDAAQQARGDIEARDWKALGDPLRLFSSGPVKYETRYGINVPINAKMSPTKRARLDEAERQFKMQEATDRLNAVFDSPERAGQVQDFLAALREQYGNQLNRQQTDAKRNLKFSLARGGLTGGSANVDANRRMGEEYTDALLGAENRAQAAVGDLRGQDESSRSNLISMIRAGLDSTTAASRAGSAMQANAQSAQGRAMSDGLGDMFGSTADLYKRQTEAAERRRGERVAYDTVYGRSAFGGGSGRNT
jgi:hypothetical protein